MCAWYRLGADSRMTVAVESERDIGYRVAALKPMCGAWGAAVAVRPLSKFGVDGMDEFMVVSALRLDHEAVYRSAMQSNQHLTTHMNSPRFRMSANLRSTAKRRWMC